MAVEGGDRRPGQSAVSSRAIARGATGLSLSVFVIRAVRDRLERHKRLLAQDEILATFLPHEVRTSEEHSPLRTFWNRQGTAPRLRRARLGHLRGRDGA
jgi:hypothetical protein